MTEEINGLIEEVGRSAVDNAPVDNWEYIIVEFNALSTYNELVADYFIDGVRGKSFNPNYPDTPQANRVHRKLVQLREKMHQLAPQKGSWYSATMEISAKGTFRMAYNYDGIPAFEIEPELEAYIIDLKKFPRQEDLIPKWLEVIRLNL